MLRIGISGWTYKHWRGEFYPTGLPRRRELEYASRQFNSVEINGSFYSLQRPDSYRRWAAETPDDFLFAVKGGRFITHMRKLRDIRVPLPNFFASGLLLLGEKLGPILWQFPPQWRYDPERLGPFLEMLPRNTHEASALAADHQLPAERAWIEPLSRPVRHAFEVRHPSFFTEDFLRLLRRHNASLVFADAAGTWPYAEDLTADFAYIRLHGSDQLYAGAYTDEQLQWWADRIKTWHSGGQPADARLIIDSQSAERGIEDSQPATRDVYVYFDNDIHAHAPINALTLARLLHLPDPSSNIGTFGSRTK